jgi:hypothetical protein
MIRTEIWYDADGKRMPHPPQGIIGDGVRVSIPLWLCDERREGGVGDPKMNATLIKIGDRTIAADPEVVDEFRKMRSHIEGLEGQLAAMDSIVHDGAKLAVADATEARDAAYELMRANLNKSWQRLDDRGWPAAGSAKRG